jgi:hypothetical protein
MEYAGTNRAVLYLLVFAVLVVRKEVGTHVVADKDTSIPGTLQRGGHFWTYQWSPDVEWLHKLTDIDAPQVALRAKAVSRLAVELRAVSVSRRVSPSRPAGLANVSEVQSATKAMTKAEKCMLTH